MGVMGEKENNTKRLKRRNGRKGRGMQKGMGKRKGKVEKEKVLFS